MYLPLIHQDHHSASQGEATYLAAISLSISLSVCLSLSLSRSLSLSLSLSLALLLIIVQILYLDPFVFLGSHVPLHVFVDLVPGCRLSLDLAMRPRPPPSSVAAGERDLNAVGKRQKNKWELVVKSNERRSKKFCL